MGSLLNSIFNKNNNPPTDTKEEVTIPEIGQEEPLSEKPNEEQSQEPLVTKTPISSKTSQEDSTTPTPVDTSSEFKAQQDGDAIIPEPQEQETETLPLETTENEQSEEKSTDSDSEKTITPKTSDSEMEDNLKRDENSTPEPPLKTTSKATKTHIDTQSVIFKSQGFGGQNIRRFYFNNRWYFVAADIVALAGITEPAEAYLLKIKEQNPDLSKEWENITQHIQYNIDGENEEFECADQENSMKIARLLNIPLPGPFARWLAELASEQPPETQIPSQT